jgi:hypothetical protein
LILEREADGVVGSFALVEDESNVSEMETIQTST